MEAYRRTFGAFAVVLILAGTALIVGRPNVFTWPLNPDDSVIYGWIFLGAAVYFLHGVVRPGWYNASGQLLGFLAYDLILIFPFLAHFDTVHPEHRTSLTVYTTVLIYSGALAIYYLFLHRRTRLLPATAGEQGFVTTTEPSG